MPKLGLLLFLSLRKQQKRRVCIGIDQNTVSTIWRMKWSEESGKYTEQLLVIYQNLLIFTEDWQVQFQIGALYLSPFQNVPPNQHDWSLQNRGEHWIKTVVLSYLGPFQGGGQNLQNVLWKANKLLIKTYLYFSNKSYL